MPAAGAIPAMRMAPEPSFYTEHLQAFGAAARRYENKEAAVRYRQALPLLKEFERDEAAIELARAGATKDAVADATGLSLEEAEAIVTFHGRGKA